MGAAMSRDHHNARPRFALHRWFTRRVWENNHDDAVPTALAVIAPAIVLVIVIASYLSPWWIIAMALAIVLTFPAARNRREAVEFVRTSLGPRSRRTKVTDD